MANMNDAPFSISLTGDTTGEKHTGKFRAKTILSHRDYLAKDKIRRQLLGDMGGTPDNRATGIAFACSELAVRLTEAPKWWGETDNGLELMDDNVVREILNHCIRIENEAYEAKQKAAEEAKTEVKAELAAAPKDM